MPASETCSGRGGRVQDPITWYGMCCWAGDEKPASGFTSLLAGLFSGGSIPSRCCKAGCCPPTMHPPPWEGACPSSLGCGGRLCPGTAACFSMLLHPALAHGPCCTRPPSGMGAGECGCPRRGWVPQWGAQLFSDHLGSIARAGAYFKGELSSELKPKGAAAWGLQSAIRGCCNPPPGSK